jgi:hypothetical protein
MLPQIDEAPAFAPFGSDFDPATIEATASLADSSIFVTSRGTFRVERIPTAVHHHVPPPPPTATPHFLVPGHSGQPVGFQHPISYTPSIRRRPVRSASNPIPSHSPSPPSPAYSPLDSAAPNSGYGGGVFTNHNGTIPTHIDGITRGMGSLNVAPENRVAYELPQQPVYLQSGPGIQQGHDSLVGGYVPHLPPQMPINGIPNVYALAQGAQYTPYRPVHSSHEQQQQAVYPPQTPYAQQQYPFGPQSYGQPPYGQQIYGQAPFRQPSLSTVSMVSSLPSLVTGDSHTISTNTSSMLFSPLEGQISVPDVLGKGKDISAMERYDTQTPVIVAPSEPAYDQKSQSDHTSYTKEHVRPGEEIIFEWWEILNSFLLLDIPHY